MTRAVRRSSRSFGSHARGGSADEKRRAPWVLFGCIVTITVLDQVAAVARVDGIDGFTLASLSIPLVGALIASRQPRNAIGWLMLSIGGIFVISALLRGYAYFALSATRGSAPGGALALALDGPLWVPAIGLTGTYLILLFPDGRVPSPRWRWWARFCGLALAVTYVGLLLLPGSFGDAGYPNVRNPLGIEALRPVAGAVIALVVSVPIAIVGCAVGLVVRFRLSRGPERVQMKWLTSAGALVALVYLAMMLIDLPYTIASEPSPRWIWIARDIGVMTFLLIPISIGIAILRYRLYDIDVVINRTLVYGALTAVLAGVYVGSVFVFQRVLSPLTAESDLAIAGSTLAVAALFRPLRTRVQRFIDRRFYRSRYDAQRILAGFTERLRDEVDLDALTGELVDVAGRTVHPAHASLWLRGAAGGSR